MSPINRKKHDELAVRMRQLEVKEEDIRENFIHSSGSGGQNVNKVATCVQLKHLPTGIEVKCQRERSQALNRFLARRRLLDKIEAQKKGKKSAEQAKWEKLRRQKRRRSRRAKEKMLREKKQQGEKKRLRAQPLAGDD